MTHTDVTHIAEVLRALRPSLETGTVAEVNLWRRIVTDLEYPMRRFSRFDREEWIVATGARPDPAPGTEVPAPAPTPVFYGAPVGMTALEAASMRTIDDLVATWSRPVDLTASEEAERAERESERREMERDAFREAW